jgi:hypothetical protein
MASFLKRRYLFQGTARHLDPLANPTKEVGSQAMALEAMALRLDSKLNPPHNL